jgi:hypothetical protein
MSLPSSENIGNVGHAERARQECERDAVVAVVHDGDRLRLAVLARAPIVVAKPLADVADPRRNHPRDATRADQLVEEDVGDRADEGEVALALADQLVTGGEGNQRLQRTAERDLCAIRHEPRDRLVQRHQLAAHRLVTSTSHSQPPGP